jgi:hypothetical protein
MKLDDTQVNSCCARRDTHDTNAAVVRDFH